MVGPWNPEQSAGWSLSSWGVCCSLSSVGGIRKQKTCAGVPSGRQLFLPPPIPASATYGVVLPTAAPPGQGKAGIPAEPSEQFQCNNSIWAMVHRNAS